MSGRADWAGFRGGPAAGGPGAGGPGPARRSRGAGRQAWERFRTNPAGIAAAVVVVLLTLTALLAPVLSRHGPTEQNYSRILQPPSTEHWFGTDALGRDVLARTMAGARVSLQAGLLATAIAVIIGLPVGLLSGFLRGRWDELVIMRIVDALQAFPFLILALAVTAALGPGLGNASLAIGIGYAPSLIRVMRGVALQVREQEYVSASLASGASRLRILLRHVLPNTMGPLTVQISVILAAAIIAEAGLSYLGLGVQPPTPSWGSELRGAQGFMTFAPWLAVWPGIAICLAVLAFNLLGDALRDAFDPQTSPRRRRRLKEAR